MRIRSDRALRPVPERVDRIACVPYDTINTVEARALAAGNPLSLLHVKRAEIDFPDGTDPYSDAVYARAKENFDKLVNAGHLVRENAPSVYVYRQQMGAHVQTGVAALCHVDDYDSGLIKKHEKTRKDKEDDRTRMTDTLSANPGPIFLAYRDQAAIDRAVAAATAGAPLLDFTAPRGIKHTVWRVSEPGALVAAFGAVPCSYIADGHHRAASAARVARLRREKNPRHDGSEDYNWFLCVLFPASQLQILPYNRLVADLRGNTPGQLVEKLGKTGAITPATNASPTKTGDIAFYLEGKWRTLVLRAASHADPVSSLDVSLLQDQVLAPLLGIDDPRMNKRIDFVGGIRGTKFLEQEVNAGRAAIAFSLHPVTIQQLFDIADAGQIMPPKSTWFEPKLRSGLFMHTF
jgi:uncharacterized protein (DUF1015 family)